MRIFAPSLVIALFANGVLGSEINIENVDDGPLGVDGKQLYRLKYVQYMYIRALYDTNITVILLFRRIPLLDFMFDTSNMSVPDDDAMNKTDWITVEDLKHALNKFGVHGN